MRAALASPHVPSPQAPSGGAANEPSSTDAQNAGGEGTDETTKDELARRAFEAGLVALGAQRWVEAEQHFRRSIAFVPKQSAMYDLAVALYKQHRARECITVLDEMLRATDGARDTAYSSNAAILRERARAELSTIRFVVVPPNAELRIDGERAQTGEAGQWLDVAPGRHEARVSASGYVTQRLELFTRPMTDLQGSVTLERASSLDGVANAAPRSGEHGGATQSFFRDVAPWVVVGVGGAALVAGVVTGAIALGASNDFENQCPSGKGCDPSLRGLHQRAMDYGHAADVLLISGGTLAAGGLVWRFAIPKVSGSDGRHAWMLGVTATY